MQILLTSGMQHWNYFSNEEIQVKLIFKQISFCLQKKEEKKKWKLSKSSAWKCNYSRLWDFAKSQGNISKRIAIYIFECANLCKFLIWLRRDKVWVKLNIWIIDSSAINQHQLRKCKSSENKISCFCWWWDIWEFICGLFEITNLIGRVYRYLIRFIKFT